MIKRLIAVLAAMMMLASVALADTAFTMAGYDDSSSHDWNNNFALQRLEEKSGITFTYTQYTDEDEWTKAKAGYKAGSADLPDVLFKAQLSDAEAETLYDAGVLIDLKPYLEEYAPNLWALLQEHPEWEKAVTDKNGRILTLPNLNPLQNNNAIWINTVWLKRVNKEMPTTAEELTEVLRAFKTGDPNNNGKADEVPLTFTGMWDLRYLAHAFGIYSNDYYVVLEDGVVKETATSEENRAFLTWVHQLWSEGLIDSNGFTSTESTRQITDSDATITYGIVMGPSIMNLLPSSELDNYQVVMPLTYNGKQVYRRLLNDVIRGTFAITTACKDPATLVAWADYFYTEEGCYLTQAGKLDSEYTVYSDGKWSWTDDATTVSETILPDYTIADGAAMPMYTPVEYQLNYDDEQTHAAVVQLYELNGYALDPYPNVILDNATRTRVDTIWATLGEYTETAMARFVTGDIALTDENWQAYCDRVYALGMQEMLDIWQSAIE